MPKTYKIINNDDVSSFDELETKQENELNDEYEFGEPGDDI